MDFPVSIMEAYDAPINARLGLTPEKVDEWEEKERERAQNGPHSSLWGCYVFDGEIVYSPQKARVTQYRAKEMHSIWFRVETGEILSISKRDPGDF